MFGDSVRFQKPFLHPTQSRIPSGRHHRKGSDMNAIIAHPDFAAIPPEEDGPGTRAEHDPVFSPERQADFLASLQLGGNVRAACRVACVSAQTAYRARRASRHQAAIFACYATAGAGR